MKNKRAYSILSTKAVNEEDGFVTITGIASTPSPDRVGDIVEPAGAKFKTPMPLLWQHRHDAPVGNVTFAEPGKDGIPFTAKIPRVKEEGAIKTRVDEAIHSLQYDLVNAVSIGFKPLEYSFMDEGGVRFTEWEWMELSLVTIPANSEAVIETVKSLDHKLLAASGHKAEESPTIKNSGVSEFQKAHPGSVKL